MVGTILSRESGYNPFFLDEREVEQLIFFDKGQIVTRVRWFGGNNSYKQIILPFEIKKVIKEDLNKKSAFRMTFKKDGTGQLCWLVYIPISLVSGIYGASQTKETWQYIESYTELKITIRGIKLIPSLNKETRLLEYIPTEGEFVEELSANREVIETAYFKSLKVLAKDFNEIGGVNIYPFQLHDLLEVYDITKKVK